jgi:hypothetical protein
MIVMVAVVLVLGVKGVEVEMLWWRMLRGIWE